MMPDPASRASSSRRVALVAVLLFLAGVSVVAGVAMISPAVAFIVAGVLLVVWTLLTFGEVT